MKLHYYPDTDSLYVEFKARPGTETIEVTEGVNVDIDTDGDVVGFDIDRASRRLDLATLETEALPLRSIKARSTGTTKKSTLLDALIDAFPDQYIGENPSSTDHRFKFRSRATIYVRSRDLNTARILYSALKNFPNGNGLKQYVDDVRSQVQIHRTQTKTECLFERRHLQRLIDILR